MHYIIFTDLDGTLLDHDSYSFEQATEALKLIKDNKIPLVICTSKTQAEIEMYRDKLGNKDPFICENGGAVIIPEDYFESVNGKKRGHYIVYELGTPYSKIVEFLKEIKKTFRISIKGFSDMSPEEVSALTGINIASARSAKNRFYSEPVIIQGNEDTIKKVKQKIRASGLNFMKGGRFLHIFSSKTDKGIAVQTLINLYKENINDSLKTIGIGDSANDLPMLAIVDIPVVVKKKSGKYDDRIQLPHLAYADGIGPEGWNKSIQKILKNIL